MNDQNDKGFTEHMKITEETLTLITQRLGIIGGKEIELEQIAKGGALCTEIVAFFMHHGKKVGLNQSTFLEKIVEHAQSIANALDASREAKALIERVKA